MILGRLIAIEADGHFIACETQCDITMDNELLPASNPDTGRWRRFIEGVKDWSVTINANTVLNSLSGTDLSHMLNKFILGGAINIKFRTLTDLDGVPELIISGSTLIKTLGISAPSVGLSSWNVALHGNGPMNVNIVTNPLSGLIINAMPPDAEYPLIVDTNDWS